jgi:hypothetical protein
MVGMGDATGEYDCIYLASEHCSGYICLLCDLISHGSYHQNQAHEPPSLSTDGLGHAETVGTLLHIISCPLLPSSIPLLEAP